MESIVLVLMMCVGFSFLIKQSFNNFSVVLIVSALAALFVGSMWPYAIEQSKTQIGDWLHNPELMLDTSVLLTIEVVLAISYCIMAAHVAHSGELKRWVVWSYRVLRWFPGIMILPVLFYALVQLIFALPGQSFSLIAWSFSAVIFLLFPLIIYALKEVLHEKELRLEFLFFTNILIGIMGIIATVNGRTAMRGESSIDLWALSGVVLLVSLFALVGAFVRRIRVNKFKDKLLIQK